MKKEAIRVSTTIPAAPTTLYLSWLSSEQHSAMTGSPAKIDSDVGGNFTTRNGYISGKLVILDLGRRLVMSWRTADFPKDAPDSRVEIHLEALGAGTRLLVLHTEIPEGQSEACRTTWNDAYFKPIRAFFSKYLPDPRKPPPPRRPIPPEDEDEDEDEVPKPVKGERAAALAKKAAPPQLPTKAAPPSKVVPAPAIAPKAPSTGPAKKPAPAPGKTSAARAAKPAPPPKKPVATAKKPTTTAGKKPAAAPKQPTATKKPRPATPAAKKAAPKAAAKLVKGKPVSKKKR